MLGPTDHRVIKEESKVINHNLVETHANSLLQNNQVVTLEYF